MYRVYNFRWRDGNLMMNNTVGLKNPNYEFIVKRMDLLIDILKKEKDDKEMVKRDTYQGKRS